MRETNRVMSVPGEIEVNTVPVAAVPGALVEREATIAAERRLGRAARIKGCDARMLAAEFAAYAGEVRDEVEIEVQEMFRDA